VPKVVPNTLVPGQEKSCTDDVIQKLLRKYASLACEEEAANIVLADTVEERAAQFAQYKRSFEDTLKKIKKLKLPIFIEHS
jgi:hypothetical protein